MLVFDLETKKKHFEKLEEENVDEELSTFMRKD